MVCDTYFLRKGNVLQSPEKKTKGVLLDAEGVQSRKGARVFTSSEEYQAALVQAGLSTDRQKPNFSEEDQQQSQPQAAVAGV